MGLEDAWAGTIVREPRGLLDGSNLDRQVTVETDSGDIEEVRVDRTPWKEHPVGDRLVKP